MTDYTGLVTSASTKREMLQIVRNLLPIAVVSLTISIRAHHACRRPRRATVHEKKMCVVEADANLTVKIRLIRLANVQIVI